MRPRVEGRALEVWMEVWGAVVFDQCFVHDEVVGDIGPAARLVLDVEAGRGWGLLLVLRDRWQLLRSMLRCSGIRLDRWIWVTCVLSPVLLNR